MMFWDYRSIKVICRSFNARGRRRPFQSNRAKKCGIGVTVPLIIINMHTIILQTTWRSSLGIPSNTVNMHMKTKFSSFWSFPRGSHSSKQTLCNVNYTDYAWSLFVVFDLIFILMLIFWGGSWGGGGVILIIVGYKWGHPKKFQMKKRVIIFYRSYPSKPTSPHPPSHPMNGPRAKNYQLILIVLSAKPLKFRTYSFSVPLKYRSHSMTS